MLPACPVTPLSTSQEHPQRSLEEPPTLWWWSPCMPPPLITGPVLQAAYKYTLTKAYLGGPTTRTTLVCMNFDLPNAQSQFQVPLPHPQNTPPLHPSSPSPPTLQPLVDLGGHLGGVYLVCAVAWQPLVTITHRYSAPQVVPAGFNHQPYLNVIVNCTPTSLTHVQYPTQYPAAIGAIPIDIKGHKGVQSTAN